MKPVSFRISFLATANFSFLKNSHCLAFSTLSPVSNLHNRRYEEEGRNVRVSVWWDFENCNLPLNTNVFKVAQSITNAVRSNGIKGPIHITAFGDVMQISRNNQEALSSTGINLCHVPSGGKNSADRSLLVDLMYWVSQNPPPAHIFLISGDRDFAGILHKLRMNNYNILLASTDSAPSVLCSAATIMWPWSSLLKGGNLNGKLFNQPPDGPYNSWYGHFKAPIVDPFAVVEQSSCLSADESSELAGDTKVRPIPKVVMKHIRWILNSYPEGIDISLLRIELSKSNLTLDKDLYGYKKFSSFLSAMPHVLKLSPASNGQVIARGVNTEFPDESVSTTCIEPTTSSRGSEAGSFLQLNGDISSGEDMAEGSTMISEVKAQSTNLQDGEKQHESPSLVSTQGITAKAYAKNLQDLKKEEKLKEPSTKRNMQEIREEDRKLQEKPKKVKTTSPVMESKDSSEKDENRVLGPASESGIFRRIRMKWFASGDADSMVKNCKKCEDTKSGRGNLEEKTLTWCESSESVYPALFSPSSHEALIDGKVPRNGGVVTDICSQGSSLLDQIVSWFKFWSSQEYDDKVGKKDDQMKDNPKQVELFSKASFWFELELFIGTSQGAAVFSQSWSRVHLAENLRKLGPPVIQSLSKADLRHLVHLLIFEKKWVEECTSQTFPFRLARPAGKEPSKIPSSRPNGLSHIFLDRQVNVLEPGERKPQNPPHTGVQQDVAHTGSSSKSRAEILADCQILMDHLLKDHPEGMNMGAFKKHFLQRHGYALDQQKLGYEKLVDLLLVMSNVRIESNMILPAGVCKGLDVDHRIQENKVYPVGDSLIDSLALPTKDDDSDSPWDELGPVDNSVDDSGPRKQETDARLTRKSQKGTTELKLPHYELLNEDDSDSEEEMSSLSETDAKSKLDEDKSSLLQILDSWYDNGKEGHDKTGSLSSTQSNIEMKADPPAINPVRRQKVSKSYSFVTDQPVKSKSKLVDGMLESLKKSNESSSDSRLLG